MQFAHGFVATFRLATIIRLRNIPIETVVTEYEKNS